MQTAKELKLRPFKALANKQSIKMILLFLGIYAITPWVCAEIFYETTEIQTSVKG